MESSSERWSHLFDDLESQLDQELADQDAQQRLDEERLRASTRTLRDRLVLLRAEQPGTAFAFRLRSGTIVRLLPAEIGRDWLAGAIVTGSRVSTSCVLPLAAVSTVRLDAHLPPLATTIDPGESPLAARLGLAFVLRDLCRRRKAVEVLLDGEPTHGTIDRVGRDHLELALHEPGGVRRQSAVLGILLIPFTAIQLITIRPV